MTQYAKTDSSSQVSNPILIKLGGSTLQDPNVCAKIAAQIERLYLAKIPVIIVHGGGPAINQELLLRGISWKFHEGQRVTTPEMMDIIEMTLAGRVNKQIVRSLNALGISTLGLCGTDSHLLLCKRIKGELGLVGDVIQVNHRLIWKILKPVAPEELFTVPIIAPIGVEEDGTPLNINADWAASRIAIHLGVKNLIYVTDQDGVLDGNKQLLNTMDSDTLATFTRQGIIHGGMLTKVRAILEALQNHVRTIHIMNGKELDLSFVLPRAEQSESPKPPRGTLCSPSLNLLRRISA